jgi:hypothetical protein
VAPRNEKEGKEHEFFHRDTYRGGDLQAQDFEVPRFRGIVIVMS